MASFKGTCVHTSISPGIEHIVQDSILVHIKPVGYVSQSVWTAGTTQGQGEFETEKQEENILIHMWTLKIGTPEQINTLLMQKSICIWSYMLLDVIVRIQGVLCVNKDDFSTGVAILTWELRSDWT